MNHNNNKIKCSVCDHDIELPPHAKDLDRITCPNCFAQLVIKIEKGRKNLRCAVCIDPKITECPPDCERRYHEREKRGFFDIKL